MTRKPAKTPKKTPKAKKRRPELAPEATKGKGVVSQERVKRKPRGVQPKKQAAKNRVAVKARRTKLLKALTEGKTNKEAGIEAGFSPKSAVEQVSQTLRDPKFQDTLCAAMESIGVTNKYLAERHKELIEATKVISCNITVPGGTDMADAHSQTKDFIDVPDHQARAKGLDMTYRLRGLYQDKLKVDSSISIVVDTGVGREDGNTPDQHRV